MPLRLVRFQKRSPNWYLRGAVRGKNVFETTGTDNRAAAEAIRIKRESEILDRSIFGPGTTVTFAEAAVSYLEAGGEARFLGKFDDASQRWTLLLGYFGTRPLMRIGQHEADEAARMICPNAGPATRKRHVYVPLCAVLNHAANRGWLPPPRIRHPKVPAAKTKWSTPERLQTLLPHCSAPLRRLVIFLTYTGARLSEALAVTWDRDIDLGKRTIILRHTKNGQMRALFVPDQLLEELALVTEDGRHGPLFPWKHKTRIHRPLKTACKRAGVEYLPPHQQGRHTYATWLRSYAGLDLKGVMEAGGWSSIVSVARYAHVSPSEVAKAAAQLPMISAPTVAPVRAIGYSDKRKLKKRTRTL